jgi:hypothetical protein
MDYSISDGNIPTTMFQTVMKTKIIEKFPYMPRNNSTLSQTVMKTKIIEKFSYMLRNNYEF